MDTNGFNSFSLRLVFVILQQNALHTTVLYLSSLLQ